MGSYSNGIYFDFYCGTDTNENLVFVHGSGCNRKFLKALAVKLTDFNCYLPDLPDHGRSKFMNCSTAEEYVEAIANFVAPLKNVTLIGHSLGGTICLGIAAKGIPAVKRCIIISSGAKYDKLDARIHRMVRDQKVNWGYLMKCLGSFHCPSVLLDLFNMESTATLLKDFAIDIDLDLEYTLKQIHIPALIMVSREDILTIPEYSQKMHQEIEGSRLIYFTRCRHMLPIAKRNAVAGLIKAFIRDSQ